MRSPMNFWNIAEFTTLIGFVLLIIGITNLSSATDALVGKIAEQTATTYPPPKDLFTLTEVIWSMISLYGA